MQPLMKTYVICKEARTQEQKINIKNVRKASLLGERLGHHTLINPLTWTEGKS